MWGQYVFLPTNVSFSGCEFQEEKCPSTNPKGFYYVSHLIYWHNPNGVSSMIQPPDTNPEWVPIQYDNTADNLDRAEVGPGNLVTAKLFDVLSGEGSGFSWEIPIRYKCQNDTDNGVALPAPVITNMQISLDYGSFVEKCNAAEYNGQ